MVYFSRDKQHFCHFKENRIQELLYMCHSTCMNLTQENRCFFPGETGRRPVSWLLYCWHRLVKGLEHKQRTFSLKRMVWKRDYQWMGEGSESAEEIDRKEWTGDSAAFSLPIFVKISFIKVTQLTQLIKSVNRPILRKQGFTIGICRVGQEPPPSQRAANQCRSLQHLAAWKSAVSCQRFWLLLKPTFLHIADTSYARSEKCN